MFKVTTSYEKLHQDKGRSTERYVILWDVVKHYKILEIVVISIQFDVVITAEADSEVWVIPTDIYKKIMEQSATLANYTNQLMAGKFTEVMWLIEQIMWKNMDVRLAAFLMEESTLADSLILHITHEKIANHMGTAREVITRMLKYFQGEGIVKLTRGTIEILDSQKLDDIANT